MSGATATTVVVNVPAGGTSDPATGLTPAEEAAVLAVLVQAGIAVPSGGGK